jgi:hypothetical protein
MAGLPFYDTLYSLLVTQHGWIKLTAINLTLFSLLHNPYTTTIMTIYKETNSKRWELLFWRPTRLHPSQMNGLALALLISF